MRRLAACLVVAAGWICLSLAPVRAEHGGPSVHVFPPTETRLPANGRITIISINGEDPSLPKKGRRGLWLVSKNEKVPLRVVETHHDYDGYGEAASLLVPIRRLKQGHSYELTVDGSTDFGQQWTIGKADPKAPVWWAAPKVEIAKDGDPGYPGYPLVRVLVDEEGPLELRLVLTNAQGVRRTALIDFNDDGCIFTGYLAVNLQGTLKLRLTAIDAGGNEAPAPGPALQLKDHGAYLCLEK